MPTTNHWILLNPDDVHQDGDEFYVRDGYWAPVLRMHHGDRVGDDCHPCRRKLNPSDFAAWRESIRNSADKMP